MHRAMLAVGICLGCALFTVVSMEGFGTGVDPARVAAGVVTGIGFLGAGAIIRGSEGLVAGLTTAASLWCTAAVGLACGFGMYVLAVVTSVIVVFALLGGVASYIWVNGAIGLGTTPAGEETEALVPSRNEG